MWKFLLQYMQDQVTHNFWVESDSKQAAIAVASVILNQCGIYNPQVKAIRPPKGSGALPELKYHYEFTHSPISGLTEEWSAQPGCANPIELETIRRLRILDLSKKVKLDFIDQVTWHLHLVIESGPQHLVGSHKVAYIPLR